MSKVFIPVTLVLFSLLALSIAERRFDNAKDLIEARDGHVEEHRPKKLFGKLKRTKGQYGPPKVHQPKKPQYGPPPHVYGAPQPVVYGPPSQAYGHPKPVHPPPQANYQPPAYHPPQPAAYSRPAPTHSHPPKASYSPPAYASPPQTVYTRPSPVYPKPAPAYSPPQPAYPQPVATYSKPAKPEVSYSPPAPSYGHQPAQVNHQPASYGTPDHDDSHEDDRKPSDDLPFTSGYNVPHSAHIELPTPGYGSSKPYEPAEPKPIVTPVFIKAELTGNRYQPSAEKLPEVPVYKPTSSHSSSQSENYQPQLEDDPPKQTGYNPKKPYSDDASDDHSAVAPAVTGSTDSSDHDDDKLSPPSESDFPTLFDPSSNFYKQSESGSDTKDQDFGFFQLGVFPKTSNFFEQNYKG
ncbi:uncharacterized protein LOC130696770 [Daphnia carinata]|uniref:uncharacterized protein LOC130696770 n=1 Tax=Daphnia carinata TaxID=120202 RepID=UPI00257CF4FD|nr:uncharacterized protein LOC130696770 [Daphnia carinata]